jgi:hypothetical protein
MARIKAGRRQRLYCVARDENVLTYECESGGHRFRERLVDPLKRPLIQGAIWMASWHSKEKGGAQGVCPKCERKIKSKKLDK